MSDAEDEHEEADMVPQLASDLKIDIQRETTTEEENCGKSPINLPDPVNLSEQDEMLYDAASVLSSHN